VEGIGIPFGTIAWRIRFAIFSLSFAGPRGNREKGFSAAPAGALFQQFSPGLQITADEAVRQRGRKTSAYLTF
jgi:hypothetical protein